jgi:excinuclease UvrABC helicase subunit UvrB
MSKPTISYDFKCEIKSHGINPDDVTNISSKYDKKERIIVTTLTLTDGTNYTIKGEPAQFAARKNKRW